MVCKSCLMLELKFDVKLLGTENQSKKENIVQHLKRGGYWVNAEGDIVRIKESGVREFLDFCRDFMDMDNVVYRIEDEEEWAPITEIENVLEMSWIDEIIKKKLIVSYSQPIIDVHGEIYAYEILSRFQGPDGSLIYPFEVFNAARNRGRLYALDRQCRLASVRYSAGISKKIFINFIPTSIYSPEFCLRSTVQLANELGMNPTQFIFEVVESDKVDDIDHLRGILAYYRERGFQYALDDAGEGYSTLEMLTDLKPQYMKLDMKYVQGVATDIEKQRVANVFLERALEVGAIPLAEGVETVEDFEWLKQTGYQLFQGYLFGKPSAEIQRKVHIA